MVFALFSVDMYKRKKVTLLHFLVFVGGGVILILFTFDSRLLNTFGNYFGLTRGADLLVYLSLIILAYFYISILNDREKDGRKMIQLIRNLAIQQAQGSYNDAHIVFVIPAYNESDHTIDTIHKILKAGHGVVFVDDGSSNQLYTQVLHTFAHQNLVAIKHTLNIGQGGALQTGFSYIIQHPNKVKYVVTFDSDGQHQLEDLHTFEKAFAADPSLDIVLGSRFMGKAINIPKRKVLTLKIGIRVTRFFNGLKLTDTHNGYRMITIDALPKLPISMSGFEHASEIIDLIKSQKLHYQEVPITVIYSEYSMAKGQKIGNAFKIVKEIIYNKFFFR